MKRVLIFCLSLLPSWANANPMFAPDARNSIGLYVAQSTGHGDLGHLMWPWDWDFNPMTTVMMQYSQPIEILRLPARVNIHALQNFAYHHDSGASFGAIGISWDIVFASICGWYFGAGLGPYMRDSGDNTWKADLYSENACLSEKTLAIACTLKFLPCTFPTEISQK